jgi:putative transposase
MKKKSWKSTPNAVYEINYHLVWSTGYRRPVLVPPVDAALKDLLAQTAADRGYDVLGLEVMADHVHIFLSAPPAVSPALIAKVLKGASARRLFTMFPHLRGRLWGGQLWTPSCYVGEQKSDADADEQGADPR